MRTPNREETIEATRAAMREHALLAAEHGSVVASVCLLSGLTPAELDEVGGVSK